MERMWGSATTRLAEGSLRRKPVAEVENARLQEQAHNRSVPRATLENEEGGGDGWPQSPEGTAVAWFLGGWFDALKRVETEHTRELLTALQTRVRVDNGSGAASFGRESGSRKLPAAQDEGLGGSALITEGMKRDQNAQPSTL